MSLDKLTTSTSSSSQTTKAKRSFAWLLPVCLLIGFILIIALLFGDRLIPALDVKVAPVVTLKQGEDEDASVNPEKTAREDEFIKGDMIFQASGWVEPAPYITYVPTLINGIVAEVHVLSGDRVKKGQLLATLIDDDAKLNLQESIQKVASLKARIEAHCTGVDVLGAETLTAKQAIKAQKSVLAGVVDDYVRLKSIPIEAISKQQLVQAEVKQEQETAKLGEAESKLPMIEARAKQVEYERVAMTATLGELQTAQARSQLAYDRTKITAPMDGVVLHLHAAPGKKRMLDMDDPKSAVIVEMYNPEKLQARIDVPLTEAANLIPGQPVELVSDLLPDAIFTGLVTSITGEADLQRNTIQCKVSIEKPDTRLRPEMLLRAKFFDSNAIGKVKLGESRSARLALYVPESAIVNNSSVWVVSTDSKAELREISLSTEKRDQHIRVLNGLRSGEWVIMSPLKALKEGGKVNH